MDENPMTEKEYGTSGETTPKSNALPWVAAVVLACAFIVAMGLYFRSQDSQKQLAKANTQMSSDLDQMHDQVQALNAKVSALMATPPAPPVASPTNGENGQGTSEPVAVQHPTARHAKARHVAKDDPRWKKMQDQLDANKQAIDSTQQDLSNARSEFSNNLSSTKDELNGTIAKNHDELVALEKKGERSYFEFDLAKSKAFQRVGPLSLSLRKTNTKNSFYDMSVLVEDSRVTKKHVSLFEPVLFYPSDSHQPVELVVNRIDKNTVRGYVSAPKYKASELAAAASSQQPNSNPSATTTPATPDSKSTDLQHRPDDQQ